MNDSRRLPDFEASYPLIPRALRRFHGQTAAAPCGPEPGQPHGAGCPMKNQGPDLRKRCAFKSPSLRESDQGWGGLWSAEVNVGSLGAFRGVVSASLADPRRDELHPRFEDRRRSCLGGPLVVDSAYGSYRSPWRPLPRNQGSGRVDASPHLVGRQILRERIEPHERAVD